MIRGMKVEKWKVIPKIVLLSWPSKTVLSRPYAIDRVVFGVHDTISAVALCTNSATGLAAFAEKASAVVCKVLVPANNK